MPNNSIGSKTWSQAYKRVLLVDASENIGIGASPKQMADGMGNLAPMLMASNMVGISGTQKLFFGDSGVYIRKKRTNVIEVGVTDKVVLRALSATYRIVAPSIVVSALQVASIDIPDHATIRSLSVIEGTLSSVSIHSATIIDVGITNANVDSLSAKSMNASVFTAKTRVNSPVVNASEMNVSVMYAKRLDSVSMSMTNVETCNVLATGKIISPSVSSDLFKGTKAKVNLVSAVSAKGMPEFMAW